MLNTYKFIIAALTSLLLVTGGAGAQEITLQKLNVNGAFSAEMAPFVHDSTLYFVSNRKSSVLVNVLSQDDQPLYKLFRAAIDKSGKSGRVTPFEATSDQALTVGPMTMSKDGMTMITTLNKTTSLRQARQGRSQNRLTLYEAHKRGNDWQEFAEIPFAKGDFSITHPSLSADGNMLFFVSDKPGGEGGTDIYLSRKQAGGWSDPENLGSRINSAGNELFPFYHPSGKLYFSSDGHGGMGGTDIFYSIFDGQWSTPAALPAPLNSAHDDFSCFIYNDELSGIFASNRDGTDNLYHFAYQMAFCEEPAEVVEDNYCFTFFETGEFDKDSVPHRYRWEFSDGSHADGAEVDHCFPGPGLYEIALNVVDTITGEEQYSVANYELLLEKSKQVYFYAPPKLKPNETIILEAELTGFEDLDELQYFWDLGNQEERQIGKTIRHAFRRKGTYTIRCEAYWSGGQLCSYRKIVVE